MPPLSVTGLGMCTALGGAKGSCAAARARLTAIRQLEAPRVSDPVDLEMVGLRGHEVGLARGFAGLGRHLLLAERALDDLLGEASLPARVGWLSVVPSAAFQAALAGSSGDGAAVFAEDEAVRRREYQERFWPVLADRVPLPRGGKHEVVFGDQAGVVKALGLAASWLGSGAVEACVVGGVDSYVEPGILETLLELGIVASPQNPAGLFPGEGAAFFVVQPASAQAPRARITAWASATDPASFASGGAPVGLGLTAVHRAMGEPCPAFWLSDLNGDEWKARDFGCFLVRCKKDAAQAPAVLLPASFGDLGAASGAVAVGMALRAYERGYAPGQSALVTLAEYGGMRGMIGVSRA